MTRWSTIDLTAKLIKRMSEDSADQWEVLELPAILDSGEPLWPEYWKIEELEARQSFYSSSQVECSIHAESNQ